MFVRQVTIAMFAAALASSACDSAGDEGGQCGKCDDTDFATKLEGLADPIAQFLRNADIDESGHAELDYRKVLFGLADQQGCGADSVMTFTVVDDLITGGEPFPRLVSTVCSDDLSRASEFFIAASFEDKRTGDIDIHDVEMFAWDADARQYRFYAFRPAAGEPEGTVEVEVAPERCRGCHLGPNGLATSEMPMTPIMNELRRPWTHWNAEPGFESHAFELPDRVRDKPNFVELSMERQGSASRFEEIVANGGHSRVVTARARKRRDAPTVDAVVAMLRPLFCDEQVNYVSEEGESGLIRNSALIDRGIRAAFEIAGEPRPWEWANADTIRLGSLGSAQAVDQLPVRGNADQMYEQQLLTVRALTPTQVLQLRLIDWKNPVLSEARCDMWRAAKIRYQTDPPDFGSADRISDVLGSVFDDMMQNDGTAITTDDPARLIAVSEANATTMAALADLLDALSSTDSGSCIAAGKVCVLDLAGVGSLINNYVTGIEASSRPRTRVRNMRNDRICQVRSRFANRPSLPEVSCP